LRNGHNNSPKNNNKGRKQRDILTILSAAKDLCSQRIDEINEINGVRVTLFNFTLTPFIAIYLQRSRVGFDTADSYDS
jgi:hypothetical protein